MPDASSESFSSRVSRLDSTIAPNTSTESWNAPETAAPPQSAENAPAAVAHAAAPPAPPPAQRTERPFEQRQDRGRGGFNDRGGRGGRNRRWGRQSGGRDRRPGRGLTPSQHSLPT